MSGQAKLHNAVNTLVDRAKHEAQVGRSKVFSDHHGQLGNSRIGIVMMTMVRDRAHQLMQDLTEAYETAIKLHPKDERSLLRKIATDGLENYLISASALGVSWPAFKDEWPQVFRNNVAPEAERLRNELHAKLNAVIPPDPPTLWDQVKKRWPWLAVPGAILIAGIGGLFTEVGKKLLHLS
jgi:hypothetical protein